MSQLEHIRMKTFERNEDDIPVLLEDQRAINRFGRLNNLFHEYEDQLQEYKGNCQRFEDGNDELILVDDEDPVMYSFGECFITLTKSECEKLLENAIAKTAEDRDTTQAKLNDVQEESKKLKARLYAKFGNNIYLEEE